MKDILVVREYTVKVDVGLRVRSGKIGPQLEKTGPNTGMIYPGLGHQYEFIDNLTGSNWETYLNCVNRKGTKLL